MSTLALPPFEGFPKIPRLAREVIITEKIDGTNGQVYITEDGDVFAGSRNKWITPQADNYGFARWVEGNKQELLKLGPGRHFGEWWGNGIQRGYGLKEKRFSLFNVSRWGNPDDRPGCCHVVPLLYQGGFHPLTVDVQVLKLEEQGSVAAPGFMNPEGIVLYHTALGGYFKKTVEKDEAPKGAA